MFDSLIPLVSYSGVVGADRHSTYVDDDVSWRVPVTSAFKCAYDGNMARFSQFSTVSTSLVTGSQRALRSTAVANTAYIFGAGVLLSVDDSDRVSVTLLDSASESLATLATTLLNGSTLIGPRLTSPHGRDVLHFVRDHMDNIVDDVRRVQLLPDSGAALNVTIHRVHDSAAPESTVRYVDVRLHGAHATLTVRCGASAAAERTRLRHRTWQRAVDAAWSVERELVEAGKLTTNSWTRTETDQLLSVGRVDGYTGVYLRDVEHHPTLVDCPRNIRFVPTT